MYVCFKCMRTFGTPKALVNHLKTDHLMMATKLLNLKCIQNNCNQTFTMFKTFRIHLEKTHILKQSNLEETRSLSLPPMQGLDKECSSTSNSHYLNSDRVKETPKIVNTTDNMNEIIRCLKNQVLAMSLNLYEKSSLPRNEVSLMQNLLSSVLISVSTALESQIEENCMNENLRNILSFCKKPFEGIQTEHRMLSVLQDLEIFEHPKKYLINNQISEVVSHGNPTLDAKKEYIVVMPLQFMFKKIFEIPNLLEITLENVKRGLLDENISSFTSGKVFRKKMLKFENDLVIPYILYLDDFQINNALGSHVFSICACYISFPSMPKQLLSKLQYIYPAAFVSTNTLKRIGFERSFHNLVEELKRLEIGIEIQSGKDTVRKIKFVLGAIVGDNLAVNSVLGFVQSFCSKRFCRACSLTKHEMQYDTLENFDNLRNESSYQNDLSANNFKETGIKSKCVFQDVPSFYVTDNFAFDLMHDVYEGVCNYDVCNVILGLLKSNILSISDINGRKQLFQYGESDIKNASIPLDVKRLTQYNMKMTASEMKCFVHFLPLMIGDLIPSDNEHWHLLLILLDIIDLLFRYTYIEDDLIKLKRLIETHHLLYTKLYGALKPKHHFLVHYPTAIRKMGPLKFMWCMRFEAKHKEAKIYFHNITSRVNPSHTLGIKSCIKFTKFLMDREMGFEPIFECVTIPKNITKENYFSNIICNEMHINFKECNVCDEINFMGTLYKSNNYIGKNMDNLQLYKIKLFIVCEKKIYVLVQKIEIIKFERHFHAFEVGARHNEIEAIDILHFFTPPLHLYPLNNNKTYVRIKYV